MNSYQQALADREANHLLRILQLLPEGIDFYSNDYLGLAKAQGFQAENANFLPAGSTGSRLLSGNSKKAEQTEQKIADFHHCEASLIYSSGYTANLGLISCLSTRGKTVLMDELAHASLIDGARLGYAERRRFKHNDLKDLESKLKECGPETLVVVESIYSMDGDVCPLPELVALCHKYEALVIVDEAHAVGLYSKGGLVDELGLQNDVTARIITYGKGPGIHGAAVVGPEWLKSYQLNFSRPLIFSTAPAPHQIVSIEGFYNTISGLEADRNQLRENIRYFIDMRKKHDGNWLTSKTQIQSLIIPDNQEVMQAGQALNKAGINVLPIRKPSVPEGQERIRFCLHSYNTREEMNFLFERL